MSRHPIVKWVDEEAPAGDYMDLGDLDFSKLIMGGGDDALDDAGDNMDFGDLDFSKLIMDGGDDALDDEFDDSSDSEDENVEEAPADSAGSDTKLPASVEDEAKPAVMRKISTRVVCMLRSLFCMS